MTSEPSTDELLTLWEIGVPLDSAWVEFSVSLDRFALNALRLNPDDDLKVHGLHNREYKELVKSGWLPRTPEGRKKKLEIITENERTHLLRDIAVGRLWAIGFQSLSGLVQPRRVPPDLFDEAREPERHKNVDWSNSVAASGSHSFLDVHVTRPPLGSEYSIASATPAGRTVPSEIASPPSIQRRNEPGRPSFETDVLAAISDHAKKDPHLEWPRRERFGNYRSYLASRTENPKRYENVSDKTLEKYEVKFRENASRSL
jgi:hypothetical protein